MLRAFRESKRKEMRLGENLGRLFLMGRDPTAANAVMILTSPPRQRNAVNFNHAAGDNPKYDHRRISSMNSSRTDKVKGTAKEVAGKVKEETGKAVGNPNLEDRGTTEKIAGKVERKVGDVKKVFGK
jgi:uncharacterized protein YjbJ (UPF0337 family)